MGPVSNSGSYPPVSAMKKFFLFLSIQCFFILTVSAEARAVSAQASYPTTSCAVGSISFKSDHDKFWETDIHSLRCSYQGRHIGAIRLRFYAYVKGFFDHPVFSHLFRREQFPTGLLIKKDERFYLNCYKGSGTYYAAVQAMVYSSYLNKYVPTPTIGERILGRQWLKCDG